MRPLHGKQLLTAVLFVASTVVLAVQLINPSPVVVSVGENGTEVAQLGGYFRYRDVGVITVAACLLGASGTYLLLGDRPTADADGTEPPFARQRNPDGEPTEELLEARRQELQETADRLADNEREIYEAALDADGEVPQKELVERTGLSKATVSRALDNLESKNLLKRERRGMGNTVLVL